MSKLKIYNDSGQTEAIRLGQRVQRFLDEERRTLTWLASRLGVNKSVLHGWLQGVEPRCLGSLIKLSGEMGVSLDELVFDKPFSPKPSQKLLEFEDLKFEVSIKRIKT